MSGKRKKNQAGEWEIDNSCKGLPPLALRQRDDREALGSDQRVKTLLRAGRILLRRELQTFWEEISPLDPGEVVEEPVASVKEAAAVLGSVLLAKAAGSSRGSARRWLLSLADSLAELPKAPAERIDRLSFRELLFVSLRDSSDEEDKESITSAIKEIRELKVRTWQGSAEELETRIAEFNKTHATDLDLLESVQVHVCKQCGAIVCGQFRKMVCACGAKIGDAGAVDHPYVKRIATRVRQFFDQNVWLEEGVAWQFKQRNYQVKTGRYILGASGVGHEIDVLVEDPKRRLRVACECKTGGLGATDVFAFAGKLRDVGILKGVMVTAETEPTGNSDIVALARSNGIAIWGSALDKSDEEWDKLVTSVEQ